MKHDLIFTTNINKRVFLNTVVMYYEHRGAGGNSSCHCAGRGVHLGSGLSSLYHRWDVYLEETQTPGKRTNSTQIG